MHRAVLFDIRYSLRMRMQKMWPGKVHASAPKRPAAYPQTKPTHLEERLAEKEKGQRSV